MTNTIPNVPRELLERIIQFRWIADDLEVKDCRKKLRAILSAPSPAGVDGLEVVAWQLGCQTMTGEIGWKLSWNQSGAGVCARLKGDEYEQPLCRLSDAQAIIDGLRGEVELLSSQKADWVERATSLGHRADQLSQRIGELEGLLRKAVSWMRAVDRFRGAPINLLANRIDATLSAGKEGE